MPKGFKRAKPKDLIGRKIVGIDYTWERQDEGNRPIFILDDGTRVHFFVRTLPSGFDTIEAFYWRRAVEASRRPA